MGVHDFWIKITILHEQTFFQLNKILMEMKNCLLGWLMDERFCAKKIKLKATHLLPHLLVAINKEAFGRYYLWTFV